MRSLTKKEIKRQDFVDNEIFDLIQKFLPPSKRLEWDIEIIGAVRDVIEKELVDRGLVNEKRFYPFVKI